MSTLKVNTVQHNTSGFNNVVQFTDGAGTQNGTLCRAWVNFNGTGTVAIRASFNVGSITDNGTGDYTVNFSNAMTDANYSVCGTSSFADGGGDSNGGGIWPTRRTTTPLLSGSVRISTVSVSSPGTGNDNPINLLAIFR